jgi:glycosyltransferase involved in cell wall biosynthesis
VIRILTGLPRPNGIGEYVAHLASIGLPCQIFYGRPMSAESYERTEGGRPGPWATFIDWKRIRAQPPPDIARTHVAWEGLGPVYGARTRLITVHHVLGGRTPWERRRPGRLRRTVVFALARRGHRRTVKFGTRTVVPSGAVRDEIIREYGADPSRVEVIPHGIDHQLFQPYDRRESRARLGLPPGAPILLHVGVDDGRKNVDGLLELFHQFRRRRPDAILIQIGPSPAIAAAEMGRDRLGIRSVLSVPGPERPRWYSAANVVVLPTYLEGFGRAALEAMSCGTPAVVSDLPVFREELGARFRGAPVGRWDRWLPFLDSAISDPEPGADRDWVVRNFSLSQFGEAYRRLYREALGT